MIHFSCGILCVPKQVEWGFLLISWGWRVTFYGFGQGGHNAMKHYARKCYVNLIVMTR